MANKTAVDDEGVFYLRPLFYPENTGSSSDAWMKFDLSPSNFEIRYETFCNDCHPNCVDDHKYDRKDLK